MTEYQYGQTRTRESGYREALWPCPTITALTALTAALEVEG